MDMEKLCPGCMRMLDAQEQAGTEKTQKQSGAGKTAQNRGSAQKKSPCCPYCGFDPSAYRQNPRCLPLNTILAGKYLVGKVLGEGGFGITYMGYDLNMKTRVAIKEYFPVELVTRDTTRRPSAGEAPSAAVSASGGGSDRVISLSGEKSKTYQQGLKKYVDEARNVSQFSGTPGVVSVKDFFYENDTAYIVMEYIEGVSLKEYLKQKGGRLSEEEALAILRPVLEALEKVHGAGIVHRDISPDNIMLIFAGATETAAGAVYGSIAAVRLIDFGAARMTAKNDQKSLTIILKHGYAPEEQYRSHGEQGPWTDVYALCAVLYRMLTGKVPEPAMDRLFSDGLKRPEELGAAVSPAVSEAIMRGLAVKKENRIQTVKELSDALYSGKKLKKNRNGKLSRPALIAALAAGLLVLGAAAVGMTGILGTESGTAMTGREEEAPETAEAGESRDTAEQPVEAGAKKETEEEILVLQEEETLGEQIAFYSPLTSISSSIGGDHVLFCLPDGSAAARGSNIYGQSQVSDWENVVAVAAGYTHSLGLRSDGKVYAAGQNDEGECDTGAWENIIAIAAGSNRSFGLRADGTVVACGQVKGYAEEISGWKDIRLIAMAGGFGLIGVDQSGEVHFAGYSDETELPQISGWDDVVWIGSDSGLAADLIGLRQDGTLARAQSGNSEGYFDGTEGWTGIRQVNVTYPVPAVKEDGTVIFLKDTEPEIQKTVESWGRLEAVCSATGWGMIFGICEDGTIRECRPNEGNAELSDMKDLKWVQVQTSPREGGLFAVTQDGRALIYGSYSHALQDPGQMEYLGVDPGKMTGLVGMGYLLEDGTLYGMEMVMSDEPVWTESNVRQAVELWSAGYDGINTGAYAMLTDEGRVTFRMTGDALEGTGVIAENFLKQVRRAEEWTNVVQILGANGAFYGLHEDGTVSAVEEEKQKKLEGISGVGKIAGYASEGTAMEDVMALMEDGTVRALITSEHAEEFGRTQTESWSNISDIAVGESHVAGLLSDGTVIAAGSNHAGQCDVEDWENIVFLTAGRNCTLGITADGELKMAGSLY